MNTENNNNIVWTVTVKSGWITLLFDFNTDVAAVQFAKLAADSHRGSEYDFSVRVSATFADEVAEKKEETI